MDGPNTEDVSVHLSEADVLDTWPPTDTEPVKLDAPGCTEQQNVNETAGTCPKQCVSTTGDQDCDGLLDLGQDLQVGTCNRLEFSDGFVDSPTTGGSKWTATGSVSWSCGTATLGPGATLSLKQDLPLPDARYLAEIRFTLGSATGVPWNVSLVTSAGTAPNYRCELWLDKTLRRQTTVALW